MHPGAKFHGSTSTSTRYTSVNANANANADMHMDAEGSRIVLPLFHRHSYISIHMDLYSVFCFCFLHLKLPLHVYANILILFIHVQHLFVFFQLLFSSGHVEQLKVVLFCLSSFTLFLCWSRETVSWSWTGCQWGTCHMDQRSGLSFQFISFCNGLLLLLF